MPSLPNPVDELIAVAGMRAAIIRPMQVDGIDYEPGEVADVSKWRRVTSLLQRRFIRPWPKESETVTIEIGDVERTFIDDDHALAAMNRFLEAQQKAAMIAEIEDIEIAVSTNPDVTDLTDDPELEAAIAAIDATVAEEAAMDAEEEVVVSTPRNSSKKGGR